MAKKSPKIIVILIYSEETELNARIKERIHDFAPKHALHDNGIKLEVECTEDPQEAIRRLHKRSDHISLVIGLKDAGDESLNIIIEISRRWPHVPIVAWGDNRFEMKVGCHGAHFVSRHHHTPPTARIVCATLGQLQKVGQQR